MFRYDSLSAGIINTGYDITHSALRRKIITLQKKSNLPTYLDIQSTKKYKQWEVTLDWSLTRSAKPNPLNLSERNGGKQTSGNPLTSICHLERTRLASASVVRALRDKSERDVKFATKKNNNKAFHFRISNSLVHSASEEKDYL